MASVRRRGGKTRVDLEAEEATLLVALTAEVLDLLSDEDDRLPGDQLADHLPDEPPDNAAGDNVEEPTLQDLLAASAGPVDPPSDPALARLLPAAYLDDDEAAGEFRRLTDGDLRTAKRAALSRIVADISNGSSPGTGEPQRVRLALEDEDAKAWLRALTDVRLTLGTRMGVTDDLESERASVEVGSPRDAEIAVYDWLSWLQDAMVGSVMGG
jgi:hypothetical protein